MRSTLAAKLATLALLALAGATDGADLSATFTSAFPCNTAAGPINAVAVSPTSGALTVGGTFGALGTVAVSNIGQWTGSAWTALGAGLNGSVLALAYDRTGSLVAGGTFTASGTTAIAGAARWNGTSWQTMDAGVSGASVTSSLPGITAFATDSSGDVVAIGNFTSAGGSTSANIALWNGSAWQPLGAGLPSASTLPSAVAAANSGLIYAADGTADGVVHVWSGSSWNTLIAISGAPLITALAVDTQGTVWAGDHNGEVWAYSSGTWLDEAGTAAGSATEDPVTALLVAPGNAIYAATLFDVFSWNGSSWDVLDATLGAFPVALAASSTGELYRDALQFQPEVNGSTGIISAWDGSTWSPLTTGLDNAIIGMAVDSAGNVDFCGRTTSTSTPQLTYDVFQARGTTIAPIGALQSVDLPDCLAIASSGQIYVGLQSNTAALALWSGGRWSPVGSLTGNVYTIALTSNNLPVLGGSDLVSGTTALGNIAMWNGTSYQPLGSGVNGEVLHLAVDGTGGIHATGLFTTAGGVSAAGYALWNGSSWQVPDTAGVTPSVLASDGAGTIYGTDGSQVIRYQGGAWTIYATSGPGQTVLSLAADTQGRLLAGGDFGGNVAVYTSSSSGWMTLGTGTNAQVNVVAIADGTAVLGGPFTIAGGTPSGFIAEAPVNGGGSSSGGTTASGFSPGTGSTGSGGSATGEDYAPSIPSTHCGLGGGAGVLAVLGLLAITRGRWRRRRG